MGPISAKEAEEIDSGSIKPREVQPEMAESRFLIY
jgi:hypothetical protein